MISDDEVDFPLATAVDCLVLLDRLAVKPSWPLLKPGALVIADTRLCPELPEGEYRAHHLPLSRTAIELGSERVANIVALGALAALAAICPRDAIERAVRAETPKSFLDLNLDALAAGYHLAAPDGCDHRAGALVEAQSESSAPATRRLHSGAHMTTPSPDQPRASIWL